MPLWKRPIVCLFHSISSRTAGFNTVDIASMTNASLFITSLLMLIGAGACSTAGGLKVSTMMVLVTQAKAAFSGRLKLSVFRRTIPPETVQRATVTTMLFILTVFLALTVLLAFEQSSEPHPDSRDRFLDAYFEVVSAVGTVGLSTGVTSHLSSAGKVIVIVLMFLGRLGPISVFVALSRGQRTDHYEHPQTSVLIG
jgi:trk system potassium uptake protein TrkH